jgi:hypothetical protein
MARRAILRASDADREQIAERLRHATAEGRLHAEELEERLGEAFSARTYGELDGLVADLPTPAGGSRPKPSELGWVRPAVAVAIGVPLVVMLLTLLAFVVTGVLTMWGIWLIVGWWFFGHHGRDRGGRYGNGRHDGGRYGAVRYGGGRYGGGYYVAGHHCRGSAQGYHRRRDDSRGVPPPQQPRPWI